MQVMQHVKQVEQARRRERQLNRRTSVGSQRERDGVTQTDRQTDRRTVTREREGQH